HVLHLQSLSTLGRGPLHRVDLVGRPQRAQLRVGALQTGAAVQAQLQATIVAAHAADDDGGADVPGLYLHLPTHSRAASLGDGQAAALAAAAGPILKGQRQIFSGGLVHLLICAAVVGLENHCDLKQGETNKISKYIFNY
uniref:Uncharacterized protein n=1 Tax=Stegastes partitus TaxID=144197 RepID=A0A3B5AX30_9TELE